LANKQAVIGRKPV